jgi:hypothetical protein
MPIHATDKQPRHWCCTVCADWLRSPPPATPSRTARRAPHTGTRAVQLQGQHSALRRRAAEGVRDFCEDCGINKYSRRGGVCKPCPAGAPPLVHPVLNGPVHRQTLGWTAVVLVALECCLRCAAAWHYNCITTCARSAGSMNRTVAWHCPHVSTAVAIRSPGARGFAVLGSWVELDGWSAPPAFSTCGAGPHATVVRPSAACPAPTAPGRLGVEGPGERYRAGATTARRRYVKHTHL